jgi:LysR family hydrogen peroxide-inducible transcriptional activator
MTFTQLEYIVAVDTCRHFADAAEKCFVTQPTLSMQIHKLENKLGTKIFDRSKQPVLPTAAGVEIIEQARIILAERNRLQEIIDSKKGIINGELKVGVIPTLAPYLLPLFIPALTKNYPHVRITINELPTSQVIAHLREGRIDAGILATPLGETGIREDVLFYEEMVAYVSRKNAAFEKQYMLPKDIDPNKLWLLEEGHCFRSQIMNLCELRKASHEGSNFEYEAGSVETLRRMVELNDGITILPELATLDMDSKHLELVRNFKSPAPVREVSIVTHRDFVKKRLIEILKKSILACLPPKIKANTKDAMVPI